MTTELQMDDGWYDQFVPVINNMVMGVTKAVRVDAQAICPVDTGDLKASLTESNPAPMVGHVSSDLDYCAAVEMGFHGFQYVREHLRQGHPVRSHVRLVNSPEQPFLRPALYRTRDIPTQAV